jgi:succinoglycan biosynthesis protein ExoV
MKLHYYNDALGNVGDDLNPWLWPKLLPGAIDADSSTVFVGIGTMIDDRLNNSSQKLVFGAGVGYFGLPKLDPRWRFYFVRGPRSAEALGLDKSIAITDAAIALRFVRGPATGGSRAVYMPHHLSAEYADWRSLASDAGLGFIDPRDDVDRVLRDLDGASLVVTEAMHGAILADVLRIPWVPVSAYPHINQFKWGDWTDSMALPYEPSFLPAVYDGSSARLPGALQMWWRQARRRRSPLFRPRSIPSQRTTEAERAAAVQMLRIAAARPPQLSDDTLFAQALEGALNRLKQDIAKA